MSPGGKLSMISITIAPNAAVRIKEGDMKIRKKERLFTWKKRKRKPVLALLTLAEARDIRHRRALLL
jgi:hypothetical protein